MKNLFWTLLLAFTCVSASVGAQKGMVLLEAEGFDNKGGWVVDQQFIDQMGSSYLLAHGVGKPVADAETSLALPKKGVWHVYVRTFNWCSPWGVEAKDAPGKFKVKVNGAELANTLGLGKAWGWEYAGDVTIKDAKNNTVALHDLTGFEGRCDAIVFTQDKDAALPNELPALYSFRKKLLGLPEKAPNGGTYDLVVVGGGTSGLCAAIKAAREGMKVALIHNRPVPGGNNSVEVKVVASGKLQVEPYVHLGDVMKQIGNVYRNPKNTDEMIAAEKNLSYFPNMHAFAVTKEGNKITSVTAKNIETNREMQFFAPLFVDCTGDGNLGFMAGAHFHMGRESRVETHESLAPMVPDNITLGTSITWWSTDAKKPVAFPSLPWAIQFNEQSCEKVTRGSNWWETGFRYDQVADAEYIRDYLFRAIYGNWAFLKNQSKDKKQYENLDLTTVFFIGGKRESRRLMGDVMVVQQDAEGMYKRYDDAMVYCSYSIDQHFPTPKNAFFFPGEEFISTMKHYFNDLGTPRRYIRDDQTNPPYYFPYRGLYSRNIDNLFMAGRQVSVSHIALASTRVAGTTGMMGELVAGAASLCKKYNCSPREVYTKHLDELKSMFK